MATSRVRSSIFYVCLALCLAMLAQDVLSRPNVVLLGGPAGGDSVAAKMDAGAKRVLVPYSYCRRLNDTCFQCSIDLKCYGTITECGRNCNF